MARPLALPPEELAPVLRAEGRRRAWLLADPATGAVRASTPALEGVARHLERSPDWDGHEAVLLEVGPGSGVLFGAFLHRATRGQPQGGLRRARYATLEDFLRDGLRLARAMGRKSALAGLWWGGGKGLIARGPGERPDDPTWRRALYREYGAFVSSLRGAYVTAEDAGTAPEDVAEVFARTRFVTCIPPAWGGSGNPSRHTAEGVVAAMEAALAFLGGGLPGARVVLQGVGQVGAPMLELLLRRGVGSVVAGDVARERLEALRARTPDARVEWRACAPDDDSLLREPCDVLAPNALGGVLGPGTAPRVRARVVCGAANNPLADEERDAATLARRGVTVVPDFVANRLGIVHCANEQYGVLPEDPEVRRHLDRDHPDSIHATVLRVLERAKEEGTPPLAAAQRLADARSHEPHPLFPGRTRALLRSLVEDGWDRG